MRTVLYLCDGQGCEKRTGCTMFDQCHHTTDPAHAVNGPCEAPWLEPGRFRVVDVRRFGGRCCGESERYFVEVESDG